MYISIEHSNSAKVIMERLGPDYWGTGWQQCSGRTGKKKLFGFFCLISSLFLLYYLKCVFMKMFYVLFLFKGNAWGKRKSVGENIEHVLTCA